jgi:enamine deaminase RidA (YjgF/YER057c/UK114 family)
MDFAGMMAAYGRHYGTAAQPNKPTRSTVEVANLVSPGAFIEVEVIAAKTK